VVECSHSSDVSDPQVIVMAPLDFAEVGAWTLNTAAWATVANATAVALNNKTIISTDHAETVRKVTGESCMGPLTGKCFF
jgi:hypothetical protein